MKRKIIIFVFGMLFLMYAITKLSYGAELSVKEVLRASDRARGNLDGIIWNIKITSEEDGSKESRGMTVKVKKNNTLAKYTSPAAINDRMVLMVDRNMWFIRSGLKKPVSLSPRQKLMGDAANGDIASTNYVEDYAASLIKEENVKNEPCYVLDLKAANKNVTYDRIKYWVSKERLVGVRAEFYTLSGKLMKTAEYIYGNRVKISDQEEIPFISELVIRDAILKDRTTTMTYSDIKVVPVPDSTFNVNLLVR